MCGRGGRHRKRFVGRPKKNVDKPEKKEEKEEKNRQIIGSGWT